MDVRWVYEVLPLAEELLAVGLLKEVESFFFGDVATAKLPMLQ